MGQPDDPGEARRDGGRKRVGAAGLGCSSPSGEGAVLTMAFRALGPFPAPSSSFVILAASEHRKAEFMRCAISGSI